MRTRIEFQTGSLAGRTLEFERLPATLAWDAMSADGATDLSQDEQVSSPHCELYEQDGQLFVRDLGSEHGTFVEGRRIVAPACLGTGGTIRLGRTGPECLVSVLSGTIVWDPANPVSGAPAQLLRASVQPNTPATVPADVLEDYELLEELGRGGMGVVYKARQKLIDRVVAIKLLPADLAKKPTLVERFVREARASARINHPNIVQGIDVGECRGTYYFVMEYIEGETLRRVLSRRGRLPETEVVQIALEMASALVAAGRAGLVHRDIKPENILIDRAGQAKLCDLGLARLVEDDNTLTKTGMLLGTPLYMAPEQAQAAKSVDGRADIYSLGASLYHVLTGQPLFQADTAMTVVAAHAFQESVHPQELVPQVSDGLSAVLRKMLAKVPNDRYPDAEALERDLTLLHDGKTPEEALHFQGKSSIPFKQRRAPIEFNCPECGHPLAFPANAAATPALCPACRTAVMVPEFNGQGSFTVSGVPTPKVKVRPATTGETARASPVARHRRDPKWAAHSRRRDLSFVAAVVLGIAGILIACYFPWNLLRRGPDPSTLTTQSKSYDDNRKGAMPKETVTPETLKSAETTKGRKTPTTAENAPQNNPKEIVLTLGDGVKMELVLIPPGKFVMGSPETEQDRGENETQHEVTITTAFYMGRYEVTQEQYIRIMASNPSYFKGAQNPVEDVSWNEAHAFCRKTSEKTGQTVRLPTEAEWEYACRAGTTTRFCAGDADSNLESVGWSRTNSGGETHPVGQKTANAWGLYDMHGNVWEWCADWYADHRAEAATDDPQGPTQGQYRVLRGGALRDSPWECRSACRRSHAPNVRNFDLVGFRVVVAPRTR